MFNDGHKPPELRHAQAIQRWGDPTGKGWQYWPFGLKERLDYALNVYQICRSWKGTEGKAQGAWIKKNQEAFDLVIAPLMDRYFEGWQTET